MAGEFERYTTEYWQMESRDEKTAWLDNHQEYAQREVWQRTSSRSDDADGTGNGKLFLSCPTFFARYSPLRPPFSILRAHIWLNSSPRIEIVTNQSRIVEIQRAIDQISPFKWPHEINAAPSSRDLCKGYLFGNHLWTLNRDEETASEEDLRLLFLNAVDIERQRFERLRRKFLVVSGEAVRPRRETIPEYVRIFVWRRDQGKCVQCGSSERLEYDHVIPVSRGGSNTERNIQLLCEICNRKKSDTI